MDKAKSFCHGVCTSSGIYSHLQVADKKLLTIINRAGESSIIGSAPNTLIVGFPYDIAFVNRMGIGQAYIKGNSSAGPDTVGYAASTINPFYIGCYNNQDLVWDGLVGDFYAYNSADYACRILERAIEGG